MFYIPSLAFDCGCLPPRLAAFLVAFISLGGCIIEGSFCRRPPTPGLSEMVQSAREWLFIQFQLANVLLMIAIATDTELLVQLYLWYTLGFVVLGLLLALMEFLISTQELGATKSLVTFIPDVTFLFVLCECLPLVDQYREQLTMHTVADTLKTSQYALDVDPTYAGNF